MKLTIGTFIFGLIGTEYAAEASSVLEGKGRIVVFGDDLGDTGNLQKATNDSTIGYNDGRLTNGPTFVEYMATSLELACKSYAYANSTVESEWIPSKVGGFHVPALSDQIIEFTENERDWIRRKSGIRSSIAVVSAGTTDFVKRSNHLLQPTTNNQTLAQTLVDSVFQQVGALGKLGFEGVAITNIPALYIMPHWRLLASVDKLHNYVTQANSLFREAFIEHEQSITGTKLWLVDLEAFLLVTANSTFSKSIGAKNTTSACITELGSCDDPADFVFYDDMHMDMRLNHLLGLATANMVNGGDIQYNATYFKTLAKDYEIGVLYHTTATTTLAEPTNPSQEQQAATTTAADPLITSTQSTTANCSLTAMCTILTATTDAGYPKQVSGTEKLAWPAVAILSMLLVFSI